MLNTRSFFPLLLLLFLTTALVFLSSCTGPAPAPETAPPDIPGYRQLREEFGDLDFTPLRGRRIVLDPGHGGFFRGAVGPNGLSEAEVNLGVALYLRGLLEWAGTEVFLTRTADYDFLSPADSSLATDLAFRINFANDLQPDVFLSIHHNSTATADPTINETQTYYPMGREDTCLDLARSIHRHLVLNLEISPARIMPGNFHVLRNARMPAVLGEPAMISNPVMAGRLSLAASQELEAQAYFLGLLDYFTAGNPRWSAAQADTLLTDRRTFAGPVTWTFQPGDMPHEPGPDPGSFILLRDGRPEPFRLSPDGWTVSWTPDTPLPDRPVVLELTGRNLKGRATPARRTVLIPRDMPARHIRLFRGRGPGGDLIRWWPADAGPDDPGPAAGGYALPAASPEPTAEGVSRFLAETLDDTHRTASFAVESLPDSLAWRLLSLAGGRPDLVTDNPPGNWRNRLFATRNWREAGSGAPALAVRPGDPVWIEARGVLPLVDPAPAVADTARTTAAAARCWVAEKILPAVYGKVIVLDPAGGGTLTDGAGPLGTRGADLNLATALAAKRLLEGAGATVHLTRHDEYAPPPQDKVRLAGRVGADLFLTIGRSAQPDLITVGHHPGSTLGKAWAGALASALAPLQPVGGARIEVLESWAYLLRHTACPALEAGLPALSDLRRELQMTRPDWPGREARSILLSVAAVLAGGGTPPGTLDIPEILALLPQPRVLTGVDWALLDGNFPWLPSPGTIVPAGADSLSSDVTSGTAPVGGPGLPAVLDRHTLEIHRGRSWQLWLLDYSAGRLAPRLMREGP